VITVVDEVAAVSVIGGGSAAVLLRGNGDPVTDDSQLPVGMTGEPVICRVQC